MYFVCSDLEGVYVPEMWVEIAKATDIPELKLTTRDIPDYKRLMQNRLQLLRENNLKLHDLQEIIAKVQPFDGAQEFLQWLRQRTQVVIVTDTFSQFAQCLNSLNLPTVFCNSLVVDKQGYITGYNNHLSKGKGNIAKQIASLNYKTIAMGDSYNDISMLKEAEFGILFSPPKKVTDEFPQYPVCHNFSELKQRLSEFLD